MDPRALVVYLESPYSAYAPVLASVREVVLAGLRWSNDYWSGLAVAWLEQGAPIDLAIATELQKLATTEVISQSLRHRAFALARRFTRELPIEELDVVRVVALRNIDRSFEGTEGVKREPRVGDRGTVVHAHPTGSHEAAFIVEAVAPDGHTLWVADFVASELQLEVKHCVAGT